MRPTPDEALATLAAEIRDKKTIASSFPKRLQINLISAWRPPFRGDKPFTIDERLARDAFNRQRRLFRHAF